MIKAIAILTTCLKLLLIPAYHSTDFEVHRNWLAITYSLPVRKWYYENTSQWTLDYPPFFAWFEYFLTIFARFVDVDMLRIDNLNYGSKATVLFQRLSVIVTDLVYVYGTYRCCKIFPRAWKMQVVLPILLLANCGLMMVDHIHFQYNGMLYGILLISIADMFANNHLQSALWFSVLLNLKHIYLYAAPAYFVYLLKSYCTQNRNYPLASTKCFRKLLKLGSLVMAVFAISFVPFYGQISQVFSRLFPVKRGLCHAYWAPNVWALYNFVDKIGSIVSQRKGRAVMTGGLVQEYEHEFLPNVTAPMTVLLTLIMMLPGLWKLWKSKDKSDFLRNIVLCSLTSFLFGWHVHEKAILMAIVPLTLLSISEIIDAKIFLIVSTAGFYSLFPLLFPDSLLLIKTLMFVSYVAYSFHSLSKLYTLSICKYSLPLLNTIESLYILGFVPLYVYDNFVHGSSGIDKRFPFLNLMLTSVYCSIGIVYCWVRYYFYFLFRSNEKKTKKIK